MQKMNQNRPGTVGGKKRGKSLKREGRGELEDEERRNHVERKTRRRRKRW